MTEESRSLDSNRLREPSQLLRKQRTFEMKRTRTHSISTLDLLVGEEGEMEMVKPQVVQNMLKDDAALLTQQTMKNYQVLSMLNKKQNSSQPQRVYMNIISQNFGVPIIEAVPLTNGGYIPSAQSTTVTATVSNQVKEKLLLESRIKQIITWFSGCNTLWAVVLIYNLFFNISNLLDIEQVSFLNLNEVSSSPLVKGSCIIFIIEYVIWLVSIVTGIFGLSQLRISYFRYYTLGLLSAMFLEVLGRLLMIISFQDTSSDNSYKMAVLVFGGATLLSQFTFLHYSRQLQKNIFLWYERFS